MTINLSIAKDADGRDIGPEVEYGYLLPDGSVAAVNGTAEGAKARQRNVYRGPWRPVPQDPDVPRVWTEHDEEPPVGTVGRNRVGRCLWTRRDDGWHCTGENCRNCPTEWAEVTGWGGPLVEEAEPTVADAPRCRCTVPPTTPDASTITDHEES